MRILAAVSLGGAGHLQPLVPFLDAARRRGDDVVVVGPAALRALAERAAVPFVGGGEPPESAVAPLREELRAASPERAVVVGNRELFGRLAAPTLLPAVREVLADWAPDLVLRDPTEYASAAAAADAGVPTAQVAISLAEAEAGSLAAAAPALEELRPGLTDELRATPYLTRFPAAVDPSPFPDTRRYRVPPAGAVHPLPDWWAGSTAPLVYVTFGTVVAHLADAADVFAAALAAVADLDARVLLTTGDAFDPAALDLPANVHVERWVDQDRVLPDADLVVCHGGSGTTWGALGAGVPVVAVPLFADQPENARRLAAAGAGLVADLDGLAGMIERALADPTLAVGARAVARQMVAAPTVDDLLTSLRRRDGP